ncbi:MAG: flavodoxin family protein [Candidatus Thorarchaeota archaeon]|jgi:flavodoxin
MTYLVVYYSRTGNNRTIAEAIADTLSADIDEIIDKKKRQGRLNWLRAGGDSRGGKLTEIEYEKNPQDYDTIIIGAPIWAWNPIPPLRTYLLSRTMLVILVSKRNDSRTRTIVLSSKRLLPKSSNIVNSR